MSAGSAYTHSGFERGHLAPREAFAGFGARAETEADNLTNVVPMGEQLNQGAWRAAERRANAWAADTANNPDGYVLVEITPIYDSTPPRLRDGTPVPRAITRRVTMPDGRVLEEATWLNQ
jgi:DNA/RNA endonuclease G (NUC1)